MAYWKIVKWPNLLVLLTVSMTFPGESEGLSDRENHQRNFCQPGGYTAGQGQPVPSEPWSYNWGRAGSGCNNLVCKNCAQTVTYQLTKGERIYHCACSGNYSYDRLDCLGEERFAGPMDYPVERPPWQCGGHPVRAVTGKDPLPSTDFEQMDAIYNGWKGTPRADRVAFAFSKMAHQKPRSCALFYRYNPGAVGREVLLEIQPVVAEADLWCKALFANNDDLRFRDALRSLALRPGFTRAALECLHSDKEWLALHVSQLTHLDPTCSVRLCHLLARHSYGWDVKALRELPLELLRACAGEMGRWQLKTGEADVYWERDYDWIVLNYARLQQQSSDFGSYIDEFLRRKGWKPDPVTIQIWRQQALQMNDNYNALPHLIRWDRAWVEDNFDLILSVRYPVRGVWALSLLAQAGSSKIEELLEVVKTRTPEDCRLHRLHE